MDLVEMYMWCTFDHSYAMFPPTGFESVNAAFIANRCEDHYYTVCLRLLNRGHRQYTLKANGKPDIVLECD